MRTWIMSYHTLHRAYLDHIILHITQSVLGSYHITHYIERTWIILYHTLHRAYLDHIILHITYSTLCAMLHTHVIEYDPSHNMIWVDWLCYFTALHTHIILTLLHYTALHSYNIIHHIIWFELTDCATLLHYILCDITYI